MKTNQTFGIIDYLKQGGSQRRNQCENLLKKIVKRQKYNQQVLDICYIPDVIPEEDCEQGTLDQVRGVTKLKKRHVQELAHYIIERTKAKIVENGQRNYYHYKMKKAYHKLCRIYPEEMLHPYIEDCFPSITLETRYFLDEYSSLKELLIKREHVRDNEEILLAINRAISEEWDRVVVETGINSKYLSSYTAPIVYSVNRMVIIEE